MKTGVRAHDFGRLEAPKLAEVLREHGFEAAQLAAPKGIAGVDSYRTMGRDRAGQIREAFEANQVEITVLGCYIDMSNPDETVQNSHMAEFMAAMELLADLGGKMVGTETSYGVIPMEQKLATWPLVLKNMDRIASRAEALGIEVAVEPVEFHTLYSPEWTRKLLDTIDSPRIRIIFDPLNMLTPARADEQERVWKECFDAFGEEIAAVHLKDCTYGKKGVYQPCRLGSGITDYGYMFRWLKEHKPRISVLREEENPEYAREDVEFMRKLMEK